MSKKYINCSYFQAFFFPFSSHSLQNIFIFFHLNFLYVGKETELRLQQFHFNCTSESQSNCCLRVCFGFGKLSKTITKMRCTIEPLIIHFFWELCILSSKLHLQNEESTSCISSSPTSP